MAAAPGDEQVSPWPPLLPWQTGAARERGGDDLLDVLAPRRKHEQRLRVVRHRVRE